MILQIYIIPTYNCNLECSKCYSKKYKEDFTNNLTWMKFVEIFKVFRSKYKNFAFIGGEPTKWKFINESILFLHYRKIIFDLSKKIYSEYIPVKISRATPLCLFNQKQRDFLISNCKLKGKCSLPTNSLVINPDGQTIQPCVELHIRHDISELSKTKPKNIFVKDINILKSNRQSTKCSNCNFYSNDECWGGCLSYPLYGAH